MDLERWRRIEEIFHEALPLSGEARLRLLDELCRGDQPLRSEVESLLGSAPDGDGFLARPVLSEGLTLLADRADESLAEGTVVGQLVVRKLIGRGGAGAVYLAWDPQLERQVALKILETRSVDTDSSGNSRFDREVRAASSISHPNVAQIYDTGTFDGRNYIAMEYVEGESLRDRLTHGRIPLSEAVDIASQIARALAAAHESGIVHRDIKPENLIIRRDGVVKVLDFGLAKFSLRSPESNGGGPAGGISYRTPPGLVLGTIAYMSPEQVRGAETDARTDIWSLGVVLCEMLTGRRPFDRDTEADTLTAILTGEPAFDLGDMIGEQPLLLSVNKRCLSKDPRDRFQSAADLAFALGSLAVAAPRFGAIRANLASTIARAGMRPALRFSILLAVVAAGILASLAILIGLRGGGSAATPVYRQLTFERGTVWNARFAGTGDSVIYSATWNGGQLEIYHLGAPGSEGKKLGLPNSNLLAVSGRGEVAVLANERYLYQFLSRGRLNRVPLDGSVLREVAPNVIEADWAPDGTQMAVTRLIEGRVRLEYPVGSTIFETAGYISAPRISPDGRKVAFLEHDRQWDDRGRVAVVDVEGERHVLTDNWNGLEGLAWRGDEVWFSGSRLGEAYALYSVDPSGRVRTVATAPVNLLLHDTSSSGDVLLSRAIQETQIFRVAGGAERELSWLHLVGPADYSADGTTILFTHFGEGGGPNYSVYVRPTDGSLPAVRIGEGRALALSPDRRFAVARTYVPEGLVLLPTTGGDPVPVDRGMIDQTEDAAFTSDGRALIVTGCKRGRPPRTFKIDISSGEVSPITPEGTVGKLVSPDGRWLVARDESGAARLFSLDGAEPRPIYGLQDGEDVLRWFADGRSLITARRLGLPIRFWRLDPDTGRRDLLREIRPADAAGIFGNIYLFATPDGSSFVYGLRRYMFDLYRVEGLD
ncbi:MAG: protein kinase domain-containing protein [Pyrinomonadaceae bacterium]